MIGQTNDDRKEKPRKDRFTRLRESSPEIFKILKAADTLEMARERVYLYCYQIDRELREGSNNLHPLEWSNAIKCLHVFQGILARRNERLTGVSALNYLWRIAREETEIEKEKIRRGFFEEFIHIFRGMHGKSNMYSEKFAPAFTKHEGRKAAIMRSDNLDKISAYADKFLVKYRTGLDEDIVEIRKNNKKRIIRYFKASETEWNEWKWQTKNIIRDAKTLTDLITITEKQKEAIEIAIKKKIPFGITPYYLSLFDFENKSNFDQSIRAQVLPPPDYIDQMTTKPESFDLDFDFMLERDTSPIDLVTRRYPKIAIFKPYNTCPQICVYCQRNWEIDEVNAPKAHAPKEKIEAAIDWFENHPSVTEVLITGGDPLGLGKTQLQYYIKRFSEMPHIERIRLGTRTLVTMPMRVNDALIELVNRYHKPNKCDICFVTHFQHVSELTPEAVKAIQRLRKTGVSIYNQQVYTFFVSRRFESVKLRCELKKYGVDPYYTFNTKGKDEMSSYRVPIARLLQERREEARQFPGTCRLDEPVYNVPRLGKNYLKAWQNHRVIMITPQGTRMYEFHPWEKNINPVHTYISEDVSIYDYLRELTANGENARDYNSIWYYF